MASPDSGERAISLATIAAIVTALVTIAGPLYPLGLLVLGRAFELAYGLDAATARYAASLVSPPVASFQFLKTVAVSPLLSYIGTIWSFWLVIVVTALLVKILLATSLEPAVTQLPKQVQDDLVLPSSLGKDAQTIEPQKGASINSPPYSVNDFIHRLSSNVHYLSMGFGILLIFLFHKEYLITDGCCVQRYWSRYRSLLVQSGFL